jgi:archaeal flagellar protein FlaJ
MFGKNIALEEKSKERSKRFIPYAKKISSHFTSVQIDLIQARYERSLEEHIAISIYDGLRSGLMFFILIFSVGFIFEAPLVWKMSFALGPIAAFMMFYTSVYSPKVAVKKKGRAIEAELPYALRHLLIEIKSGVPLYQSLVTISEGYGACSDEIKAIVKDINAGRSSEEAIEENIIKNPSLSYRRSFWHVLNAIKAGTSLEKALDATVNEILANQMLSIKKYGQELNPWTLMYMMFGVILPSLGIAFMLILSTFAGFAINGPLLYSILFFLTIFQVIFLNVIRTKRPMVKV